MCTLFDGPITVFSYPVINELRACVQQGSTRTVLPLSIDPSTGALSVSPDYTLDHETRTEYWFAVVASDLGQPVPRTATATVRLTVTNSNDCAPTFVQSAFSFGVVENQPGGTEVGTVSANDNDMAPFNEHYYLLRCCTTNSPGHPSSDITGTHFLCRLNS